jgi:hypothetical protein
MYRTLRKYQLPRANPLCCLLHAACLAVAATGWRQRRRGIPDYRPEGPTKARELTSNERTGRAGGQLYESFR